MTESKFFLVSVTLYTLLYLLMTKRFQSNNQQSFILFFSLSFFIGRAFHNNVAMVFDKSSLIQTLVLFSKSLITYQPQEQWVLLCLYSLKGRTSYHKLSQSPEAARSIIILKYDMHLSRCVAKLPVKCRSDTIIITSNLAASRLHEVWQ